MLNQTSSQQLTNSLTSTIQTLNTSLQAIKPPSLGNSETTQLITYSLIAVAVIGIFFYHYIKQQEQLD